MSDTRDVDPFDPPAVEWKQVEPKLITVRMLGLLVRSIILLGAGSVVAIIFTNLWTILGIAVIAGLLAWNAWVIPRQVRAISYAIRDRDFFKRSGLMFRHLAVVPYIRIQYVDINQGPIERSFGLSTLTVHTASPSLAATLPGITPETAAHLRQILTDRQNLAGRPVDTDQGTPPPPLSELPPPWIPPHSSFMPPPQYDSLPPPSGFAPMPPTVPPPPHPSPVGPSYLEPDPRIQP